MYYNNGIHLKGLLLLQEGSDQLLLFRVFISPSYVTRSSPVPMSQTMPYKKSACSHCSLHTYTKILQPIQRFPMKTITEHSYINRDLHPIIKPTTERVFHMIIPTPTYFVHMFFTTQSVLIRVLPRSS